MESLERNAQDEQSGSSSTAWGGVIERYSRLVYSIPRRFGLRGADADDVFQSTILTAMRREPFPPPADRIVRWLASIAFWETRNVLRKRASSSADLRDFASLRDSDEPPRAVIEEAEELQTLTDALATLRPRERLLLEALFLEPEPLSYQQVADRLGIAIGSIGGLRQRAIVKLREELLRRGF